jgi:hypothetical protein
MLSKIYFEKNKIPLDIYVSICYSLNMDRENKNRNASTGAIFLSDLVSNCDKEKNMTAAERRKIRTQINNKLADISNARLALGEWINRAAELHPDVSAALEGIWCGREGNVTIELPAEWKAFLCMGWYNGKVEWSYIS